MTDGFRFTTPCARNKHGSVGVQLPISENFTLWISKKAKRI